MNVKRNGQIHPNIDLFVANSHLVQNQLKMDVTPIITYTCTGYTPYRRSIAVT